MPDQKICSLQGPTVKVSYYRESNEYTIDISQKVSPFDRNDHEISLMYENDCYDPYDTMLTYDVSKL